MLRTFLTPLRARFDLSPRSPSTTSANLSQFVDDDLSPEDFARDVLIELMRNSVEALRGAEDMRSRIEVLAEVQRIMLQDACTKEVFRELDGFVILMSVLSTIQATNSGPVVEPPEQRRAELLHNTRLVFMVTSEGLKDHKENTQYFNTRVGYDVLAHAIRGLLLDPTTADETLGSLLALALQNFSISGIITSLHSTDPSDLDNTLSTLESQFRLIHHPGAIRLLWDVVHDQMAGDPSTGCLFHKLFDHISRASHRNKVVLCSIGLVGSLFDAISSSRDDEADDGDLRRAKQEFLKRLLEVGTSTHEARTIQRRVITQDGTLDSSILEIIRTGMRARSPSHFSVESQAALLLTHEGMKGMPTTGFTYMSWIWIDRMPVAVPHSIFGLRLGSCLVLALRVRPDGKIEFQASGSREPATFEKATISAFRWTHIALVYHPQKAAKPCVRLFLDGVLSDTMNLLYPRPQASGQVGTYIVGDDSPKAGMSWCLASAYLLSVPLADDLPRFVHHLGPRYCGNFQDPDMMRFLTYEASTSLNLFLSSLSAKNRSNESPLFKVLNEGLGISESSIVFSVSPASRFDESSEPVAPALNGIPRDSTNTGNKFRITGNVFLAKLSCLDVALWKIGSIAVTLRIVQMANTTHELSRALGILTDALRNNWQNLEEMERLRGYDILMEILRAKYQLVNMTSFETLFEFLGMNFRSPDQSVVMNKVAYRAVALDFEFWSRTRKEIQRVHLEHFLTLLQTSRHKRFNVRQRMSRMGIVRKLLFTLQTEWYHHEMVPFVIGALRAMAQAQFTQDDAIKPIVSYLAANLHEDTALAGSPRSVLSHIDHKYSREKAEQVLESLVSILSAPTYFTKFTAVLPLTRICLLLLGDRPVPVVASQVLQLIGISLSYSSSFSRKFELVSGWSILKTALPFAWDPSVHESAFDILLGRVAHKKSTGPPSTTVVCPYIMPSILCALQRGLNSISGQSHLSVDSPSAEDVSSVFSGATVSTMEVLIEELIDLHASSPTFRLVFRSQQITQLFIDGFKDFLSRISSSSQFGQDITRILEKLTHFGLTLALDTAISVTQKHDILDVLRISETLLYPSSETTAIDSTLINEIGPTRSRFATSRISMQIGEKSTLKSITRIQEWRKTVMSSERKRLRKTILDHREHRRQISRLNEWSVPLSSERGLWEDTERINLWKLDETEGPHRIRKKLERDNEKTPNSRVDMNEHMRDVHEPDSDAQSIIQVEAPPWAESYEIASTEMEDRQLAEDITEDKHRRVRHELEPGDVIEAVGTVARIVGVDSSPGLLIFGRTHLYMLDGLVESDDGEVIDASEAPKRLFFVPGSILELTGPQRAHRWSHDQVANFSYRTFLFRDVGLEIYFKDSRSLLVVFTDKKRRQDLYQRLCLIVGRDPADLTTPSIKRSSTFRLSARVLLGFRDDSLSIAQRKWQAREISNFAYLSIINQLSGRTPSDATQYPIFPWVLQDYTSDTLDLTSPKSFRDLTKPMGALTPARREAAEIRYSSLESVNEKPFHYGTHFSSSMIVCHFLIRLAPFTHMFKTIQGGDWDLPDRLFVDISRAYESASQDARGDVRELIPEFFTCPEFLENSADIDFGVQQNTGEKIHHVKLPPWAKQDPLLFIILNRRALESDYVSEHLPAWIDLIWGCNQRDPELLNVFHPLSYEGAIDLDSITDELEREATVGIIHNFGQTPRKLFISPHPERYMHGLSTLPLGTLHGVEEDAHLFIQGSRPVKDLGAGNPVYGLVADMIAERMIPCPEGVLTVPIHTHEQVEWGPARTGADELRLVIDRKVVQVIEATYCTCAAFADSEVLVTGSSDHTVRLWRIYRGNDGPVSAGGTRENSTTITLSHIMRVHTEEVLCVAASRAWSAVVSGSKDGSAALWDLNRGLYVRSIWHGEGDPFAVHLATINESTGYVATCSRAKLCLHTINARVMATLDLTGSAFSDGLPSITSLAFHEREYSYLGVLATGGADGTITLRTWTTDGTPAGENARWEFITIRTMKVRAEALATPRLFSPLSQPAPTSALMSRLPAVTALQFVGESLYHGEDTGRLYFWELPD